jgi:HlyD family secretion protein
MGVLNMNKKIIAVTVSMAIIGGLVGLSIVTKNKNKYKSVKTAVVTKGDIKTYLSTTALIKSQDVKEYYGPQAKVIKVNVKVGDNVKKGDTLVTYDVQDLNTSVKQAEIQYNNAILQKQDLVNQNNDINNSIQEKNNKIADLDKQIKQIYNQIEVLNKNNNSSALLEMYTLNKQKDALVQQKSSLIQQRDALKPITTEKMKQADNTIENAQLSLNTAKQNLEKSISSIVADRDGVVTAINVIEGAMGTLQQPAVIIQNIEDLKATLSVSRYDANKIKLDQSALIRDGSNEYNGKVAYIAPLADLSKNPTSTEATLSVDVNITDKNPQLKIGFEADVDILLEEATNVIKVPVESIKTDKNGKSVVYIVEDNKAVEREVKKGVQSETDVEIEGVEPGDKVILNPTDIIQSGTLVK